MTLFSSTQIVIVLFSCIVLTLRAAFYDIEIAESKGDDEKEDRDSTIEGIPETETKVFSGSEEDEFELSWKPPNRVQ